MCGILAKVTIGKWTVMIVQAKPHRLEVRTYEYYGQGNAPLPTVTDVEDLEHARKVLQEIFDRLLK